MNSKAKGASFEREICRALSLWITNGRRDDVFWRSSMSGGRATVARMSGKDVRQCGDICAVSFEGNDLVDTYFIECKHVRRLALDLFLIRDTGPLAQFWRKAKRQAFSHKRDPVIIARQNGYPTLVICKSNHLGHWAQPIIRTELCDVTLFDDWVGAYARSSDDRPTPQREPARRVSVLIPSAVAEADRARGRPKIIRSRRSHRG